MKKGHIEESGGGSSLFNIQWKGDTFSKTVQRRVVLICWYEFVYAQAVTSVKGEGLEFVPLYIFLSFLRNQTERKAFAF